MRFRIAYVGITLWVLLSTLESYAAINAGNDFSIRLFRSLGRSKKPENLVISPYAIRWGLGMAAAGAKGKTQRQLGKAPDSLPLKDPSYRLLMANRLWVQNGIPLQDGYLEGLDKTFGIRPWIVDFTKAPDFIKDRMNGWVLEKTAGKISDFIHEDSIAPNLKMVLGSAISFKASWMAPFDRALTKESYFVGSSQKKTKVPFVNRTGFFHYAKEQNAQLVELPFLDGEFSFVLILPRESGSLADFEETLKSETLDRWVGDLTLKEVSLSIPKFEVSTSVEISEQLKLQGIVDPFLAESADFSGMSGNKDLVLDRVFHKTQFLFMEEGTEVGSVAGPIVNRSPSSESNPVLFKVDHPFLFVVRHRMSGTIVIMGSIEKL